MPCERSSNTPIIMALFDYSSRVAANQHSDTTQYKDDVFALTDTIQVCRGGVIAVVDLAKVNPFHRAWSIYEWDW